MSDKYVEVRGIAKAALLPDFFAVRIDEEGLFALVQELVAKIRIPGGHPKLDLIKNLAATAPDATSFIEGIKEKNLWNPFRELMMKGPVSRMPTHT